MVESNRVTEDSGTEKEAESSDGEDPQTLDGVEGADQLLGYIIHLANAVKLYQKKNQNCFGYGSPDHLAKDCPRDLSTTARKVSLNMKEGMMYKGGWTPQKPLVAQPTSQMRLPEPESIPKISLLESWSTYLVEYT